MQMRMGVRMGHLGLWKCMGWMGSPAGRLGLSLVGSSGGDVTMLRLIPWRLGLSFGLA